MLPRGTRKTKDNTESGVSGRRWLGLVGVWVENGEREKQKKKEDLNETDN